MSKLLLVIFKLIGFGLLFLEWTNAVQAAGFIPIILVGILTALRLRRPFLWPTIALDGVGLFLLGEYLALSVFVISEIFYRVCEAERARGLQLRDAEAGRYYELEQRQGDLLTAAAQIERMTAAGERARIARDIHDNAGHEIVAGYMLFQTIRVPLGEKITDDAEMLALYDAALNRLDIGANKIREAVHNLAPLTAPGTEALREACKRFPGREVHFSAYGDTSAVPVYGWHLLEACLNEALTNTVRHSQAKRVEVELDATPTLVRLSVENDGVIPKTQATGMGLRNLRHRAAAVGGNISVDAGEVFRMVCVVPFPTRSAAPPAPASARQ